ncbi:hypothetical protein K490DRAFT_49351 [Saccharata proteae CBS 121410]|uniref:Sld7 C-terminal domain-containing protein n=1 Tax=Saccharata proteae CBS 121410 TaxID=1314787 RepID=A0A9P4HMJ8_9PEZI|nr:hypothetical protein K490DRAFT_49351 [Saccharata proteae CBS 121410]
MGTWSGSIVLPDGNSINDIELSAQCALPIALPLSPLRFLAVVEVSRIPLHLAVGPSFDVWTSSEKTESWFSGHILDEQVSAKQSSLGILAQVDVKDAKKFSPRVTEILFYGTARRASEEGAQPTPKSSPDPSDAYFEDGGVYENDEPVFRLRALPLSSDLVQETSSGRPPSPPQDAEDPFGDDIHAQFLPHSSEIQVPVVPDVQAPVVPEFRKRQSVSELFDEADNRRKKAKRHGGESVAAAASKANPIPLPHRRSSSQGVFGQKVEENQQAGDVQANPKGRTKVARSLSRSPSLSSDIRPQSRQGFREGTAKPSSLSRVTSIANADEDPTIETRNKDAISRLVMAGMRMYGLQPRKKDVKSRNISTTVNDKTDQVQTVEELARDEEYKLVYHQTNRGAVFAFRNFINTHPLYQQPDQLRDTVDKLLAIFCADPLLASSTPSVALTTPAEKNKTFGDNVDETERSPFDQSKLQTPGQGIAKTDLTACVHRPNIRRTPTQDG